MICYTRISKFSSYNLPFESVGFIMIQGFHRLPKRIILLMYHLPALLIDYFFNLVRKIA
jgi:hypothetical protein